MADGFAYDVFLSHSSKDKEIVRKIAERLQKDGLKVWFDEWLLKPGDSIPSKIEDGLEHSRVLVFCMSANSFGSDWGTLESQTFRFRDPLNRGRRFIPVRLDDTPIKGALVQFLYLDWRPDKREKEYKRLFEVCQAPVQSGATGELDEASRRPQAGSIFTHYGARLVHLDFEPQTYAYSFSTDGNHFLFGGTAKRVWHWDIQNKRISCALACSSKYIWTVSLSSDHRRALSGGEDNVVRLWDLESGSLLRAMEGHIARLWNVVWSPDGKQALSCSSDGTVRVWDLNLGECVRIFRGHNKKVLSVAWNPNGQRVVSGASDNTLRLWDVATGRCLRTFKGHTNAVRCVAWSPGTQHFVSGSYDNTIRLWEAETGACLHVFEGHTSHVVSVACAPNGRYVLSGSSDQTIDLWDLQTGRCLCTLRGHTADIRTVAWSSDGRRAFSGDLHGSVWAWDLSSLVCQAKAPTPVIPPAPSLPKQIQYANAKVLLVGDTGVGKSGLAERMVRQRFLPTKSSHARQAHVLETEEVKGPGDIPIRRETVLWDLAGQPAYRLVHQLSMEDTALACVLFDCRNETNPFEAPAYWSQVLDQARTQARLKKLLVASRIDVGGLPASKERIEGFVRENGFERFLATSASTGEGCDELLKAIRAGIPWDYMQKVTTTATLAALRDYIAALKGEKRTDDGPGEGMACPVPLLTVQALYEGFATFSGEKIPLNDFISHLERLEATDAVDLLVFHTTGAAPQTKDLVLLDPTRVDAYASALLVAAKDEPDGPGHILESRAREMDFRIDKEERIPDRESERHVMWFVLESLLSRDLALRERIRGEDYVVFPSQCTAAMRFPGSATLGVVLGFAGPVRSIYATLIAQLAHYEGFKKREFFLDAAAYRAEDGGRCLIRLRDGGRGRGELDVLFDTETPTSVRQGFLEFVTKHLESKSTPDSVTRRHAYHCSNTKCRNPFDDHVVRARLEARKKKLICPICEMKTPLLDLLASPTRAAQNVAAQMDWDAVIGRRRMTAGLVIKAKEVEGKFDVFLSHNSKDKGAVEKIAKRLLKVGIRPWLDKWNLAPGDTVSDALEKAIKTIPCAALCFGPADVGKWHIMEIRAYVEKLAAGSARIIPVALPGVEDLPELPLFVRQTLWVDMRNWEDTDCDGFYRFVCGVLGRAPGDSPVKRLGVRHIAEWQGIEF